MKKLFFILLFPLIIFCWNLGYYVEPKVDVEIFFSNDSTVLYKKVTVGEGSSCLYLYQGLEITILPKEIIEKYEIVKIKGKKYPRRYWSKLRE